MEKQTKINLRIGSSLMAGLTLLTLMFVGCDSVTSPQQSESITPLMSNLGSGVLNSEMDASYYTVEGFYFLPPMVDNTEFSGTFDPDLSPVVEICETPACNALHVSFDMAGEGSEQVRMVEDDEHYIVNWNTNSSGAEVGQTYRVQVSVDGLTLGHADVHVVRNGREADEFRKAGEIAIVANQTLPVKFRIETGIVSMVIVSPAEATIDVGATQQFEAVLLDLHGEVLNGPEVFWSSDEPDVATVDGDGLALGLETGEAIITASAGAKSGSAVLKVEVTTVFEGIASMPEHAGSFTGFTRGYYFVAPVDFQITGVRVLQAPGNNNSYQNWAIVRFNNAQPPPQFTNTTNNFEQLAAGFNKPSNELSGVAVDVQAGDVIGIYGNTTASAGAIFGVNSYSSSTTIATTEIMGHTINLIRSGMQSHLGTGGQAGMQNIWRETNFIEVSRVEFTYVSTGASSAIPSSGFETLAVEPDYALRSQPPKREGEVALSDRQH